MVIECPPSRAISVKTRNGQTLFTVHALSVSVSRRGELAERGERGLLAVGQHDEARQAEQLEELDRVAADVREDDGRAATLGGLDDAEQDRDADAVHKLRAPEVDDQ